ncbi:hypothetical protein MHYP_G00005240 [Metynnis hypsauchen]
MASNFRPEPIIEAKLRSNHTNVLHSCCDVIHVIHLLLSGTRSRTQCYLRRGQGRRAYIYHYIYQIVHFPVDLIGRKLTPAEQRYAALEREALAIKWAIEELRFYLTGRGGVPKT